MSDKPDWVVLEHKAAAHTDTLIHGLEHGVADLCTTVVIQTRALLEIVKRLDHARYTSEVAEAREVAVKCLEAISKGGH